MIRRIGCQAGLGIFGLERNGCLPAAAFGRDPFLAEVARLVRGDAEQPRLELAFTLEGIKVFDDGQKSFLADLLAVFAGKIRRKLEDEPPRRCVMQVEEFIPRPGVAATAARQQFGFGAPCGRNLFEARSFEQISCGSILRGVPSDWV